MLLRDPFVRSGARRSGGRLAGGGRDRDGGPREGELTSCYDKFVQDQVYADDQDKMRRIASAEVLKEQLSLEQPAFDVDFRRRLS